MFLVWNYCDFLRFWLYISLGRNSIAKKIHFEIRKNQKLSNNSVFTWLISHEEDFKRLKCL